MAADHALLQGQQLFVVAGTAAHRGTEAAGTGVLHVKGAWGAGGHGQTQGEGMGTRFHIADGPHPCAVLQDRLAAAVEDARVDVGIDHGTAAGVLNGAREHVAARSLRAADAAAVAGACRSRLGSGIGGVAGGKLHGAEFQVGGPGR